MRRVDLDDFEATAVGDLVRQPLWEELTRRAYRRRRRWLATAATIVTALVAGAVPVLGTTLNVGQDEVDRDYLVGMVVLDVRTAVATRYGPCGVQFRVTSDGGANWGPASGPEPWGENCVGGKPPPQGFEVFDERTFIAYFPIPGQERRYLTRDGGATWRRLPTEATPVDAYPLGALTARSQSYDVARTTVLDPHADRVLTLRTKPPVWGGVEARRTDPAALWALGTGEDLPNGPYTEVANSSDRGRTWHVSNALPAVAEHVSWVAVDTRRADLIAFWYGTWHLHQTTDGGQTWSAREMRFPGARPARLQLITATGNRLMMVEIPDPAAPAAPAEPASGALWVSDDGGVTLRRAAPLPSTLDWLGYHSAGGLLWIDDGVVVRMTEDGDTWREMYPPAF